MALAILLLATLSATPSTDLLLNVGDEAPPFAMRDLNNKVFSMRDHTGSEPKTAKKAVVMVFFATWCKPCMKEVPIVKALYSAWKDKGVEIIYVGLSQGAKELAPFAQTESLPWRVIPDSFGLLARRYGVQQLPHLFIVGADGKIAFQHRGIAENLKSTLEQQLARVTGEPVPPTDATQGALNVDRPRFATTYSLGRAPSSADVVSRWQPLAAYLGEAIKANVEVASEPSYEAFEAALKQGKYDLANAGPLLCYEVRDRYEPVARIERQETPAYYGILFTLRQSPIRSLADLKGKKIGLVSEKSTSGGLYQELALIDAHLTPGKDVSIVWLGSHSKVAEAVKAGAVDAGGCYEGCMDALWPSDRAKAMGTRLLGYTSEIPAESILVRRSLDAETKKAVQKALLAVNQSSGILAQISEGEKTVTAIVAPNPDDDKRIETVIAKVAAAHKK
jgi:phosphate/phosphite/phosphonate ABC transporter binding protein